MKNQSQRALPERDANAPRSCHSARYLVLFGDERAPRAALFDTEERFLAEMVGEDAMAVDDLVRASSACAPPCPAMVHAIEALDHDADLARARCFRLG